MNGTINTVLLALILVIVSIMAIAQFTGGDGASTSKKKASAKEQKITDKKKVDNPFAQQTEENPFEQKKDPLADANAAPTGPTTSMKFDNSEHDFGPIYEGDKVEHTFKFTNTGSEPLIISNAKGSCGCTVPKWPKEPLGPGETGEMLVSFDSKGKPGSQTKTVTVTANTEPAVSRLTIKAEVAKKEGEPSVSVPAN